MTVTLQRSNSFGGQAGTIYGPATGDLYLINQIGQISVDPRDEWDFIADGWLQVTAGSSSSNSLDVKDFGIFPNTGVDVSAGIQAAIDYCATNKIAALKFNDGIYICAGLQLRPYIQLVGTGQRPGWLPGTTPTDPGTSDVRTIFQAPVAGGTIITDISGGCSYSAIIGIDFRGRHTVEPCSGVVFGLSTYGVTVRDCQFYDFANESIWISGGACILEDLQFIAGLQSLTIAAATGVVRIEGSDHWVYNVEATTSATSLYSTNFYKAAFYIASTACVFVGCVGEISDVGFNIVPAGSLNKFSACRADNNFGHGFFGGSFGGTFTNCNSLNNSQAGDNLYSGYYTNAAVSGMFGSCTADSSGSPRHKYGFENTGMYGTVAQRNEFVGCRSFNHATGIFKTDSSNPDSFLVGNSLLQGTGATPNIEGTSVYFPTDVAPITITNFLGGIPQQDLFVTTNPNVTIQHNGNIVTKSGSDITFANYNLSPVYFKFIAGVWFQVGT